MNHYSILVEHIKNLRYAQLYEQGFDISKVSKKELNFLVFGKGYDDQFFTRILTDMYDMLVIYLKSHSLNGIQVHKYEITQELIESFESLQLSYYSKSLFNDEFSNLKEDEQLFVKLELTEFYWNDKMVIMTSNLLLEIIGDYFNKVRLLKTNEFNKENEKCLKLLFDLYVKEYNLEPSKQIVIDCLYEVYDHILQKRKLQSNFILSLDIEVHDLKKIKGLEKMFELSFLKFCIDRGVFFNYNKILNFDLYNTEFICGYTFYKINKHFEKNGV